MAGDSTRNNEIGGDDDEQGASARGEPHSRVGGILECNPPGNRNSLNSEQTTATNIITDGVCRYGVTATSSGMSFIEICQVVVVIIINKIKILI